MSRSAYPQFRCADGQANSEAGLPATEEFDADAVGADGRVEDVEDVEDNIPDLHNAEIALESQEQRIRFHVPIGSCRPVKALLSPYRNRTLRQLCRKLSAKCSLSSKVAAPASRPSYHVASPESPDAM